jgi:hypothetical protein
LSHLIFCNSSSAASSTMHGETHGGGRVVPSWMVLENGAIGFARTIFSISAMSLWRARSMDASHSEREPQRTRATAYASHSTGKKRVVPHSYGDGGRIRAVVSFLLLRWRQGGLGVEMGCCLNYWQWDAGFDGSPLLDRKLGRCCGRGTAVVSLVLEEWPFLGWCGFGHGGFGFGWSHIIQQMSHDGTIRPPIRKYSRIF